jgi:hypothetical protein
MSKDDLKSMSKIELYELASSKSIRGRSTMSKGELIGSLTPKPMRELPPDVFEHILETNQNDMGFARDMRLVNRSHYQTAKRTRERFIEKLITLVIDVLSSKHDDYKPKEEIQKLLNKHEHPYGLDFGIKFEIHYGKNELDLSRATVYSLRNGQLKTKETTLQVSTVVVTAPANKRQYDGYMVGKDKGKKKREEAIKESLTNFLENVKFPVTKPNQLKADFAYTGSAEGSVEAANEELAKIIKEFNAIS